MTSQVELPGPTCPHQGLPHGGRASRLRSETTPHFPVSIPEPVPLGRHCHGALPQYSPQYRLQRLAAPPAKPAALGRLPHPHGEPLVEVPPPPVAPAARRAAAEQQDEEEADSRCDGRKRRRRLLGWRGGGRLVRAPAVEGWLEAVDGVQLLEHRGLDPALP
eukprot:CAMPEP_0185328774 /NCGR_PEP_ID=MMETSP1363-20130426/73971_1 /TAXON_ID=38817 /ORGANISM="Gephyrocapsa oceanica, Strain RCC1303" /LENGTH=161 /DNA_ID=CAMNT_0027927569 /DNA_START=87 /DNA_END=568 /DNA_ORIENTATION=-